ncbi:acyl-CoA-binding protein [Flavobacteriaceae bacterium F89]|mgnify:CR=1 FL=1|uniref:Acyl-CoA-binding protein n=1 Tax=Cerina litoralis TaxID=2874477 RepID=A0AAE3EYV7_9FLAO|nr:acyl-CoA-binding protein [Cerina litoralis]MCG2462126.1 acyl-CoA-binding protein [Cerina litoralis]
MSKKNLRTDFEEAVEFVNNFTDPLPADFLLKIYAYYKIANNNFNHPGSKKPLINAFKANALIQARNLSPEEAMKKYVALINKELRGKDR